MSASSDLVIANCNTIAVAARDFAADLPPDVPGTKDVMAKCGMCYNIIAETCDMLVALNKKGIDLDDCEFEPMICVATIVTEGLRTARTEA